jgi:hypothetical protein
MFALMAFRSMVAAGDEWPHSPRSSVIQTFPSQNLHADVTVSSSVSLYSAYSKMAMHAGMQLDVQQTNLVHAA